jgi:hypothetical protein
MREEKNEHPATPKDSLPRVDLSQLRERLKLTPAERLRVAAESANNLRDFLKSVRLRK